MQSRQRIYKIEYIVTIVIGLILITSRVSVGLMLESVYPAISISGYAKGVGLPDNKACVVPSVNVEEPLGSRAIIVAGASLDDDLWTGVVKSVQSAYKALNVQRYSDDDIYLMSPVAIPDVNKQPLLPDLGNLHHALNTWAGESTQDVILYLVGKGFDRTFSINQEENLTASLLDNWLDSLQERITGKLTVIYDACRSGSFIPVLASPADRIVISSTNSAEPASFASKGDISFSGFFWKEILNGTNTDDAFSNAYDAVNFAGRGQTPCLDSNGDGYCDEGEDTQAAKEYVIGMGIVLTADNPVIGNVSPPQNLNNETSATIWAENVSSTGSLQRVWAVIVPPDSKSAQPDPAETCELNLPILDMAETGNGRFEGTYYGFTESGTYEIIFYAADLNGGISKLGYTEVTRPGPDAYEPDNTHSEASVIFINDKQKHNFYEPEDADWVKFYGLSGVIYEIEAVNVGQDCDAVIELYRDDFDQWIRKWDQDGPGDSKHLAWLCELDSIYYVKMTNKLDGAFGKNTRYDLEVNDTQAGPDEGVIEGYVTDSVTGDPVNEAKIRTSNKASALSESNGFYQIMDHDDGDFILGSDAAGYDTFNADIHVKASRTTIQPVPMNFITAKGDINGDGLINLKDALMVLRIMSGTDILTTDYIFKQSDINDHKIGLEEAIYILKIIAELKYS